MPIVHPEVVPRRYNRVVERTTLMRAIKECFEAVRIHHGWGIAEVAQRLDVHYETARRLRAGEIKEPSFTLVAGLHSLAQRSMDSWVGITPAAGTSANGMMEDRVRELVVDQLGLMLTRGLTLQLPMGANGEALEEHPVLGARSVGWAVNTETRPTEDALFRAGQALVEEVPAPDRLAEPLEQIKRRARTGNGSKRSAANGRR